MVILWCECAHVCPKYTYNLLCMNLSVCASPLNPCLSRWELDDDFANPLKGTKLEAPSFVQKKNLHLNMPYLAGSMLVCLLLLASLPLPACYWCECHEKLLLQRKIYYKGKKENLLQEYSKKNFKRIWTIGRLSEATDSIQNES